MKWKNIIIFTIIRKNWEYIKEMLVRIWDKGIFFEYLVTKMQLI